MGELRIIFLQSINELGITEFGKSQLIKSEIDIYLFTPTTAYVNAYEMIRELNDG